MSKILFYAINGIGLGHVARLSVVARAIRRSHPDIELCYHSNCTVAPAFFPCEGTVDSLRCAPAEHYRRLCRSFEDALETHQPDLLVCDTHWPDNLAGQRRRMRKAIVLRKPAVQYARDILTGAALVFDAVLLPHSQASIDDWSAPEPSVRPALSDPRVHVVGPIARVAERVPAPMNEFHVLFLLGGGGAVEGAPPVDNLVTELHDAALQLHASGIPSQIVQGPFMDFTIPAGPWENLRTYDVPRYIDTRTVVVARPSYGSCWETIAAGARLVIVAEGNGFREDAVGRAERLEAYGLAVRAPVDIAGVVQREIAAGWSPADITLRAAVNRGLPDVVERLVQLAKEN